MKILVDMRKWLDDTAARISKEESDPERWDTPLLYLMEALEAEAESRDNGLDAYERMLQKVRDAISDQLDDKTWGY